jgi:hypothetical protein
LLKNAFLRSYQDMILPSHEDRYCEEFLSYLVTMSESEGLIREAINE